MGANNSQTGSKIPTMGEGISSLQNLLNTCRKARYQVNFKEKPTYWVRCLYSSFVHDLSTYKICDPPELEWACRACWGKRIRPHWPVPWPPSAEIVDGVRSPKFIRAPCAHCTAVLTGWVPARPQPPPPPHLGSYIEEGRAASKSPH
jgi:hypothetical protein